MSATNSPVVVPVVPKTKGRGKKASTESVAVVDALPAVAEAVKEEKPKAKGRAKKVATDVTDDVPLDGDKPRKNLIAKHALLHAFTLHLAKTSLDNGLFDQDLFDRFLSSHSFFLDVPSLSLLFQNLDLKILLKNAKNARKTFEKKATAKEKKPRAKKDKKVDGEPTDLISSLVSLASNKEPIAPPASPENTLKAEEPGEPVKQKRKYNRKPKVESIAEELVAAADNE